MNYPGAERAMQDAVRADAAGDPSLGTSIRARRLGWRLSKRHGCFIRMSNDGGQDSLVELCPVNAVPSTKLKAFHRCWWETPEILDMLPWLKMVRAVKKYIVVTVGDDGAIKS